MKILFVLICLLSLNVHAQQISLNSSVVEGVYSSEELQLLQRLSQRHIELLEKQKMLEEKEKQLDEKEAFLKKMQEDISLQKGKKNNYLSQVYMQMSPSKAVELLNDLSESEVITILDGMPAAMVSRLLDKMPIERSKSILKNMSKAFNISADYFLGIIDNY